MSSEVIQAQILQRKDLPDDLLVALDQSPDHLCRMNGYIYHVVGTSVLCCPDSEAGNELVRLTLSSAQKNTAIPEDPVQMMSRIFSSIDYVPDQKMLRKCRIDPDGRYCVAVFQALSPQAADLHSLFSAIVPTEKDDIVIPVEHQSVALVRNLKRQSTEEFAEYTEAVLGTMEVEGISGITAGIGREAEKITGLRNSYLDAKNAIRIGTRYHSKKRVFQYTEQGIERILECIPADKQYQIRHCMFGDFSGEKLSGEMLETARVFFLNDLNLTATSRQLFIHRNTLNYRLDKIKKDFGLDLRSFNDALVFRIITGIADET